MEYTDTEKEKINLLHKKLRKYHGSFSKVAQKAECTYNTVRRVFDFNSEVSQEKYLKIINTCGDVLLELENSSTIRENQLDKILKSTSKVS